MQLPTTDLKEQACAPTQSRCTSRSNNTVLLNSFTEKQLVAFLIVEYMQLQAKVNEMQPKVQFYDEFLSKSDLLTTTVVAKAAGFSSANALNKELKQKGILIKQNKQWHPSADYNWLITEGYCSYDLYTDEKAKPHLKWTYRGMLWIKSNKYNEGEWKRLST